MFLYPINLYIKKKYALIVHIFQYIWNTVSYAYYSTKLNEFSLSLSRYLFLRDIDTRFGFYVKHES